MAPMQEIPSHERGLAGYILPLGGVLVPIIIWVVKSDSPAISTIAKQAVLLNVMIFLALIASFILWITIVLIPVLIILALALGLTAIVLPIVGAVKASEGLLYRYPVIGGMIS